LGVRFRCALSCHVRLLAGCAPSDPETHPTDFATDFIYRLGKKNDPSASKRFAPFAAYYNLSNRLD